MKIALNLNSYENPLLTRVLPFARELGIHAVELWGCCLEEDGTRANRYEYRNKKLKEGLKLLEQNGMEVCVLTFGLGLVPEETKDAKRFSEKFCDTVRLAKSIGAPCIIHHMNGITGSPDPQIEYLRPYWEPVIECAEQNGIVLALENESNDATWCPENTKILLDAFHSPSFTANFDSGNYYYAGNEAYPHAYHLLRGRIGHVHMKGYCVYDENAGLREDLKCVSRMSHRFEGLPACRCAAECGGINNDGLIRALAKDGYRGYISLEHHGSDAALNEMFAGSVKWLRSMGLFEEK